MRDLGSFRAPELATTHLRRGEHDTICDEARELLLHEMKRGLGDFVVVRLATSGVEVFRYRPDPVMPTAAVPDIDDPAAIRGN